MTPSSTQQLHGILEDFFGSKGVNVDSGSEKFEKAIRLFEDEVSTWREFNAHPELSQASPEIVRLVTETRLISLLKAADSVCKTGLVVLNETKKGH